MTLATEFKAVYALAVKAVDLHAVGQHTQGGALWTEYLQNPNPDLVLEAKYLAQAKGDILVADELDHLHYLATRKKERTMTLT